MGDILLEIGLLIGIATVLAFGMRIIKQPPILAYILTGVIVGPLYFNIIPSSSLLASFSHIAIAFLLFIVGLKVDYRILKNLAFPALVVGIGQVVVTAVLGFYLAKYFGFVNVEALFIALALSFSSTFIVVKLISDKKELDSLHGKIALGVLIVQDSIAALVLAFLPVITQSNELIGLHFISLILFISLVFLLGYLVTPLVLRFSGNSQEIIFLFGVSWALLIAYAFGRFGFSIEVGALVAGMSLASSKYNLDISNKVHGLRDFFVILFFIFFGSFLTGPFNQEFITYSLAFSALVFLGNPLIIMQLMKLMGYKKRTNFLTGISLAQTSEFSLVLILLGFSSGLVTQRVLSSMILVAIITFTLSSYSMFYSNKLYAVFAPYLKIFDNKGVKTFRTNDYEVILFGYNRIGYDVLNTLRAMRKKFLVVDHNPEIISSLSKRGIPCVYGDANDPELLEELKLDKVKSIISTIPDVSANIDILRKITPKTTFIGTAQYAEQAQTLYKAGANYVITPHFIGGQYASNIIIKTKLDKQLISLEAKEHLKSLSQRRP